MTLADGGLTGLVGPVLTNNVMSPPSSVQTLLQLNESFEVRQSPLPWQLDSAMPPVVRVAGIFRSIFISSLINPGGILSSEAESSKRDIETILRTNQVMKLQITSLSFTIDHSYIMQATQSVIRIRQFGYPK